MHDVHNYCLTRDGVAMSSSYIVYYHHRDCNLQNSHCTPCKLLTGKALILLVAAATLAAGAVVIVHLKAKPCRRVCTTLCNQETGPSRPSMMVTGRN